MLLTGSGVTPRCSSCSWAVPATGPLRGLWGLRSHRSVGNIVQAALGSTTDRRDLLTDEAFAVWQERTERLFQDHWAVALDGNYRSSEVPQDSWPPGHGLSAGTRWFAATWDAGRRCGGRTGHGYG